MGLVTSARELTVTKVICHLATAAGGERQSILQLGYDDSFDFRTPPQTSLKACRRRPGRWRRPRCRASCARRPRTPWKTV